MHSGSSSKLFTVATGLDVSPVASEDTDFIGGMAGWVLWKFEKGIHNFNAFWSVYVDLKL